MNNKIQETGASIASQFKHKFIYFLIFVGGRGISYLFLYIVVFFYSISPLVYQKSKHYVKHRFHPKNRLEYFKHIYLLNLTFGKTLVDRAALGILNKVVVISTDEEREIVRNLLAEGKGLILLSAHVGCWQMAVNLIDFLDKPINLLYYKNPKDNDKMVSEHGNRKAPFKIINPSGLLGGIVDMMAALEKGEVVCAMADRVFGDENNSVSVSFLGGKIRVPYSFYKLASAMNSPILISFFPWLKKGTFGVAEMHIIRVNCNGKTKENYLQFAQEFVDALEQFCIKYPYQFFNYFDLWENNDAKTN